MVNCPGKEGKGCGNVLNETAKFCSECGWKIDHSIFYYKTIECPECKHTIDRANKFCSECGWKVDQSFFKKRLCDMEPTDENYHGCQSAVEPKSQYHKMSDSIPIDDEESTPLAGCQSAVEAEYECDKMSDSVPIDDEESTPLEEWRIVLIGKTGVGKSKSANSILGTQVFKSELSGVSVTQKSQIGRANRFGKKILLVDTPGIFDTKIPMPSIWKEIAKCIGLTSPGLHAIIFVVQVDRYTDEDQQTVDMFLKRFGEDSIGFLIVLFTRKDDLKRNKKPFNEFIDSLDKESNIAKLIQRCSKRCIAFDNFCSPEENDAQVRELFTLIGSVISKNEGGMYSNKMYEAAEEEFRRIEEEELAKMEIEREEEIKKIRKRGAKGKKDPNYQQKQIVAIEEKYKKKKKIPIREHIQDQCVEEKSGIFARILRILRSYFSGK